MKTILRFLITICYFVSVMLVYVNAYAHSGRTNSSWCHNDRINWWYHCHNGWSVWTYRLNSISSTPKKTVKIDMNKSCNAKYPWTIYRQFDEMCVCPVDWNWKSSRKENYHCKTYSEAIKQENDLCSTKFKWTIYNVSKWICQCTNWAIWNKYTQCEIEKVPFEEWQKRCNEKYPESVYQEETWICWCKYDAVGYSTWSSKTYCEESLCSDYGQVLALWERWFLSRCNVPKNTLKKRAKEYEAKRLEQIRIEESKKCNSPRWTKINNGSSIVAYQSDSVEYWWKCQKETRQCTNWKLSGTFQFKECSFSGPKDCFYDWSIIKHWKGIGKHTPVIKISTDNWEWNYSNQCYLYSAKCNNWTMEWKLLEHPEATEKWACPIN